jgi:putative ABC transport system permease protein
MIGLALVATMSVVGTSSKASIDHLISGYFQGDLVVSNVVGSGFSPSIADKIATTSGVSSVARLRYDRATYRGSDTGINGVDPASIGHSLSVPMVSGSAADLSDGSVLVSQKRAVKDHLGIGDTVRFTMPTGKKTYQVAGIMQDNSPVLFYPFTTTLTTLHRAGFQAQDNFLIVTTSRGTRPAALKRVLDEQTKALPTVTVKDQAGYAAEQRGQFNQLLFLIYALLALALVIAVLGIVNTLALSVIERTREIGLLRAIGLSRRQLRRMIRLEAVVIAVLGAILGVAMGVVFGVVLMVSLRSEGLDVIAVPYVQLAILVIASVGFGILAAALPARRAGRLDVLTAIASE